MKALTVDSAVISAMGTATGYLVNLSIAVNRYRKPLSRGKGPTRSTCMWLKREEGVGKVTNGAVECLCVLLR